MSNSMSITTFKSVAVKLPACTSILLRANHGVGKSKVVRQVSALIRSKLLADGVIASKDEYPVIDRRLSQMSEGDMVGLPSTDGEVTRFNPPDWYKKACNQPCALFLDELNRATPEVMQAAFQIVLDRELNGWKLHPHTRVYSAVNASANYTVNEMDPALLDRFWTIDLNPDVAEFCLWARSEDPEQGGNLHPVVPDFIETTVRSGGNGAGDSWLYPPRNVEQGSVNTSPRSWEHVNRDLTYANLMDAPQEEAFYHITLGHVGVEAAIAFRDFVKSVDNRISGDEIVNNYHKPAVRKKVTRLGQGSQNSVVDKVADYVIKECTKLTDEQGKNIKALMKDLPEELRISLWGKMTSQGIDKIELAKSIHKWCVEEVLAVFGVPVGEAGVGVTPNIPGIFKNAPKTDKK